MRKLLKTPVARMQTIVQHALNVLQIDARTMESPVDIGNAVQITHADQLVAEVGKRIPFAVRRFERVQVALLPLVDSLRGRITTSAVVGALV